MRNNTALKSNNIAIKSNNTALDKLWIVLIELEYACADFTTREAEEAERQAFPDLEPLFSRLLETSRAIQVIIDVQGPRRGRAARE
jgi:hypothetical protein